MSAIVDAAPPAHRFTRERYEQMIEAGIFGADDRIELLDGEIVEMAPQKSRHATAVTLIGDALRQVIGPTGLIRIQLPLALGAHSEPEPDIAVVRGNARDYRDAHPRHAELIVEVAETTLAYDRGRKLAAYARASIPEYWIVDVAAATLEVCRAPLGEGYGERRTLRAADRVAPLAAPDAVIDVSDLLP